jgi:hypothetical protein
MRSKLDARIERRGRKGKAKPLPGGKALQRLFNYLGERDPALNDDVLANIAVPKAARPRFGLTKRALRAKSLTTTTLARSARGRRATPEARSLAAALIKAAERLGNGAGGRRGRTTRSRARPTAQAMAAVAPAPLPSVWQAIGPSVIPKGQTYGSNRVDVIGRVSSIAVDPKNPKHLLLGAAGGGIWESGDAGSTWVPRTDHLPSLAIGAIAFDQTAPSRVYAGSGEGNFYANLGAGVYKSTNGGTSWAVVASSPFVGVGFYDLVVDPKTPATLYAAASNGFYRSTDSGGSWSLGRAGRCWDISVHPSGGSVELLAAFVDGLFVSTNSGSSFTAVKLPSAPTAAWSRLAVDRVAASPDIAYVFGAAGTAAHLWRRSGTTWSKITNLPALSVNQAWYDWYVATPPDNKGQVFLGAIDGYRGDLSGSTWKWTDITTQGANSIHPDQHCLTFSPGNSKIIYAGNDGGIFRSTNSGSTWTALNKGLGITEIEYLAGDPNTWKWLMAGTQDNGTIRFTGPTVWDHIADGDGGDCGVNQLNPNTVYHSYFDVTLERSDNKGNNWTNLAPTNLQSLFYPPVEVFGSTVAIGAASLVVTRTGTAPWTTVPLGLAAGEFPSAMREVDANTILVGTTTGHMLKMAWTGASWTKTNLTSPTPRYISCITVDPSNPQRIWVTISRVGGGQVYRSDNGGTSWTNCTATLPAIPMNALVVDPANFKRVWVAADVGVYETVNLGASWASFSNGLPNAMAADLLFHKQDRMLICGTRNRGAWVVHVP